MKFTLLFTILLSLFSVAVQAQDLELYQREIFVAKGDTLPYRILYPENFDPAKKYPLLLFLHGRGESGKDNQRQLTHGAKLFLREDVRTRFPAIVVFPQCPADSYWSNVHIETAENGKRSFTFRKGGKPTAAMASLVRLTEFLEAKPFVDKSQYYVGGLSMGGMGTFELLRRQPKLFAAAFAICGGDHVANVRKYKSVPLWVFHGAKDDVVPPAHSQKVVDALQEKGAQVRFTLYPEANHNSWDPALAEPELLPWLFSHQKNKK